MDAQMFRMSDVHYLQPKELPLAFIIVQVPW